MIYRQNLYVSRVRYVERAGISSQSIQFPHTTLSITTITNLEYLTRWQYIHMTIEISMCQENNIMENIEWLYKNLNLHCVLYKINKFILNKFN